MALVPKNAPPIRRHLYSAALRRIDRPKATPIHVTFRAVDDIEALEKAKRWAEVGRRGGRELRGAYEGPHELLSVEPYTPGEVADGGT